MDRVDYGFMGDVGHWRWTRIRFQSGYDDAILHTPDHEPRRDAGMETYKKVNEQPTHNNNSLYVSSKTSTQELETYSVGHHAPRGETWQKLPKTHVWKYSGRPSKDNIDALAQLIGSHLQHGKEGQNVRLDGHSYSDGGTVGQRIRERLDVPQFQQCGHKCQRGQLNDGPHRGDSLHKLCCRCMATALWFGVRSRPFGQADCTIAEADCFTAGQVLPDIGAFGGSHTLSFKNGIVGPSPSEFYAKTAPDWHGLQDAIDPTDIQARHFGWWAGLFRPMLLSNKNSWSDQQISFRLVDSVSVISGRRNIQNYLCLPGLSACKGVPSYMFHVARGFDIDTAKRFHAAEVKALCPDKKIKNPVTYTWKRTDQFALPRQASTIYKDLYENRTWEHG